MHQLSELMDLMASDEDLTKEQAIEINAALRSGQLGVIPKSTTEAIVARGDVELCAQPGLSPQEGYVHCTVCNENWIWWPVQMLPRDELMALLDTHAAECPGG